MTRRERREFTTEFKLQMVTLHQNSKPRSEIIKEYDLTPSAFNKWVKQYSETQSFKHKDNLTDGQKLLIAQEKELKQLRMENDILKARGAAYGTKIKVIRANRHKYAIRSMCKFLGISRACYYKERRNKKDFVDKESNMIER